MLRMNFSVKSVVRIFIATLFHTEVIVNMFSFVHTLSMFRHTGTVLI